MRCASLSPARAGFSYFAICLSTVGEIGERELGVDRLDVGDRIDPSGDVHDVVVLEAAHDMRDRIGLADRGQKLVAQSLALRRPGNEPGDIDELHGRGQHLLRVRDRSELGQTRIGNFDDADIGLDRAERVVLGGNARPGQRVEERRLPDVGQADNAASQTHGFSLLVCRRSIARSKSPAAIAGHAVSARSIAASIAERSPAAGGART